MGQAWRKTKPGRQTPPLVMRPFAIVASLALAGVAQAAAPVQQGWAHAAKVVDLQPNGVALTRNDALARQMVAETISRWGIAYDEARLDVIASLFTADATFEVLNGSATPIATAHGRDEIVRTVRSTLAQQGDQRRHLVTNIVIDRLTASAATLLAYAIVAIPGDPSTIGATVIYRANLRRERDGIWRFTRLTIAMDSYAGIPPKIEPAG